MSVRFGFLGAGWIARTALAPAVHAADGAVLQAVGARSVDRARELAPAGAAYGSYQAVLEDRDVDVVYVSLANDAHVPWTVRALQAGKHVLCEKPLGLDAVEVAAAVAAAQEAGRLLVEAFWYRWHPRTRRAESLVADGGLGRVTAVDAAFCFDGDVDGAMAGNYRLDADRGGGALYDVGVYPVSAARWALGEELSAATAAVEAASATWSTGRTGSPTAPVDLSAEARLRTPGGAVADVRCAISRRDELRLDVSGDEAVLRFDAGAYVTYRQPCTLRVERPGGDAVVESFDAVDPYQVMVEAVARRVRGEDAFVVSPADSLAIARLTDVVRASLPRDDDPARARSVGLGP